MRVLVLGAGVIGLSIADALARRGADVTVLDPRAPGRGASHASAGILAPFTEAQPDSPLLQLGKRSLAMYDDFVALAADRSSRRVEYARTGTLQVACDEPSTRHLRIAHDWLQATGIAAEWLEAGDLPGIEPSVTSLALGGLWIRSHGFVGVASLMSALVHSARRAGAVFETPVEVASISTRAGDLVVRADGHPYSADAVVVATGCWSGRIRIDDLPSLPVRPVRGQLLALQWPDDRRAPQRIVWGPDCYVVPWSDGTALVGATSEDVGFDERTTVDGVAQLSAAVRSLLPDAGAAALDVVRVGLRPATPDGLPIIGRLSAAPRVVVATGHHRNGILLAPLTADLVSRLLLDETDDPAFALTTPDRF